MAPKITFSANLGFLWTDLDLPDAIRAAAAAGFAAVECHWPYETPTDKVKAALQETGLPMLGINTVPGNVDQGEMGLAALPNRVEDAQRAIDQALDYAAAIKAEAVHVMAGCAKGEQASATFQTNLAYACERASSIGLIILIEALNPHDAPGYFLNSTTQAANIIRSLGASNLKLMFDCYHVGRSEGDVITRLRSLYPLIGHVQIAAVPDRGTPDHGELFYPAIYETLKDLGWRKPLGAEYKPLGPTDQSLEWMTSD